MKKFSIIAFISVMMLALGISAFASDGVGNQTTNESPNRYMQREERQIQCEEEANKQGLTLEEYRAQNCEFAGYGKGQMQGTGNGRMQGTGKGQMRGAGNPEHNCMFEN